MTETPDNPILYYGLRPVRQSDLRRGGIATAACVQCIATGRILEGMGGPGYALSPEIVDALDMAKSGLKSRVILDASDLEEAQKYLLEHRRNLEAADGRLTIDYESTEGQKSVRISKGSNPSEELKSLDTLLARLTGGQ